MENFGGFGFNDLSRTVRKKRSNRPRNDSQSVTDNLDNSPLSSMPPSDNGSKASSEENAILRRKELTLNQCNSRASYTNIAEAEMSLKIGDEDGGFEEFNEAGTEGVSEGKDSIASKGNDNKLKRVKLKLGGVTRTIHAKSVSDKSSVGESSRSDATRSRQKLILQDDSDEDGSPSPDKGNKLRGVPWKDFSRGGFNGRKVSSSRGKIPEESAYIKQSDNYEPVRKSKRVPKRRLLDGAFSEDDEEIRFLEKLKTPKVSADYGAEYEDDELGTKKHRRISRVLTRSGDVAGDYGSSRSVKESKKSSRSMKVSEDNDYVEDEEPVSDVDMESKRKKQLVDSNKEMAVTTRQRAHLQTGKDPSSGSGASLIEFPNGLPPAPPRKQKEKLTDVEQQLKKAEAAQRRKMQVEKAARESEAEAIRKILGQDSSRKKREEKIKKRQEELAQERTANVMTLASNTVRWIMGPTGTVVTFPDDTGLPSILEPKPCCYPPPREQCAGPFCTNPYKYRDSKSRLPLCSLQCYKAIHEKMQPLSAC